MRERQKSFTMNILNTYKYSFVTLFFLGLRIDFLMEVTAEQSEVIYCT